MAEIILIWWVLPALFTFLFLCWVQRLKGNPIEGWKSEDVIGCTIVSCLYPVVYLALIWGLIKLILENLTTKVW